MRTDTFLRTVALAALTLAAACSTTTETKTVTVSPPDSTYLVEWLPGSTGSVVGKSTFQVRVRKRADASPGAGLTVTVSPVMHMPTMTHGTPVDVLTESAPGTYDGALYYLMSSGTGMGYWALDVAVNGEVHTVYPSVGAAAGTDTVRATLFGPADGAGSMASKYYLFRDGPFTGTNVLALHVSHGEAGLMAFKAVDAGASLDAGAVTTVVLYAAVDPAFGTSVRSTGGRNGHFALDLSRFSLAPEVATTVYVRLRVNGEDKTTNGLAPAGANAAAEFVLTPGAVVPPAAPTYVVEYVPSVATVGKSTFQLRVRTAAGGTPVTGMPISITPVMHMPTMVHGSPAAVVTESAVPGTYDGAVYYLMASGPTMGYWELRIDVGGEIHLVYPSVGMAMGTDTVRVNLFDVGASTASRTDRYLLFRDGPLSASSGRFALHLSRGQDMIMAFPTVEVGQRLSNGVVSTLSFAASSDAAFTTPIAGTYLGDGRWTFDVSSMSLDPGVATTVYVRLAVDGETKTTDAAAAGAANSYATFAVTPR